MKRDLTKLPLATTRPPAAKAAAPANDKQAMAKRTTPDRLTDYDAWFENRLDEIDNGR